MFADALGPEIDHQRCNLCGACIAVCSHNSLTIIGQRLTVITPENCDDCGSCEDVCPQGAIACVFEIVTGVGQADEPTQGPPDTQMALHT